MRRDIFAVLGTIAGLVGLLSFKTQTAPVTTPPAAIGSAPSTGSTPATGLAPSAARPVQVKITATNGTITSATAADYPQNNDRDQEINASAIPTLVQESIGRTAATAANIDMVSGATYTSTGYVQSLQSALNQL